MNPRIRPSERLKSRKAIDRLFRNGRRVKFGRFRILYRIHDDRKGLKAAFAVPRKKLKKAHDRNRVRRLMKESFRHRKEAVHQVLQQRNAGIELFILFLDRSVPEAKEVDREISGVLERLTDALKDAPPTPDQGEGRS